MADPDPDLGHHLAYVDLQQLLQRLRLLLDALTAAKEREKSAEAT